MNINAPVSVQMAKTIETLKEQLKAEFGKDFSFVISGKGFPIAASTYYHGEIKPTIKPPTNFIVAP